MRHGFARRACDGQCGRAVTHAPPATAPVRARERTAGTAKPLRPEASSAALLSLPLVLRFALLSLLAHHAFVRTAAGRRARGRLAVQPAARRRSHQSARAARRRAAPGPRRRVHVRAPVPAALNRDRSGHINAVCRRAASALPALCCWLLAALAAAARCVAEIACRCAPPKRCAAPRTDARRSQKPRAVRARVQWPLLCLRACARSSSRAAEQRSALPGRHADPLVRSRAAALVAPKRPSRSLGLRRRSGPPSRCAARACSRCSCLSSCSQCPARMPRAVWRLSTRRWYAHAARHACG